MVEVIGCRGPDRWGLRKIEWHLHKKCSVNHGITHLWPYWSFNARPSEEFHLPSFLVVDGEQCLKKNVFCAMLPTLERLGVKTSKQDCPSTPWIWRVVTHQVNWKFQDSQPVKWTYILTFWCIIVTNEDTVIPTNHHSSKHFF